MPAPSTVPQAGELRSARIESLRAVAALVVVVGHVATGGLAVGATGAGRDFGLAAGGYGVFLFFALSGYLLFRPFARRDFGRGGAVDLRGYARNRALRILPLYYVVLALLLVVQEGGGSATQWWRFATFSESFFSDTLTTLNGPMWSLAVEMQFYVLLPVLGWGLAKLSRRSPGRATLLLVVLGAASLTVWCVTVRFGGVNPDPRWRYSLPVTFLAFVPGMLLALLQARLELGAKLPRLPRGGVLLLLAVAVWLAGAFDLADIEPMCVLASLFVLAAILLPVRHGRVVSALDWRPLAALGVASYSLYLCHEPVVTWLSDHFTLGFLPLLAIALPACAAVSAAGYVLIERRFLGLRRRWAPATAAVAPRLVYSAPGSGSSYVVPRSRSAEK